VGLAQPLEGSEGFASDAAPAPAGFLRRFRPPRLPRRVRFFGVGVSPSAADVLSPSVPRSA